MGVRVLGPRDLAAARAVIARDPVVNVFVDSLVQASGLDPRRGAEVWGYVDKGGLEALCHAGGNMVPVGADDAALRAFAAYALRRGRNCFQILGPAREVEQLWTALEPHWGPAREVRDNQPFMVIEDPPLIAADPLVRAVEPVELPILYPACVAMYTEEVGVPPQTGPDGTFYRSRVAELIRAGRAFARIEDGRVVFKAEVGSVGTGVCQIQGVWVDPEFRGRGLAAPGMAAVVELARQVAPVVTLYVNAFNAPARAAYERVGFRTIETFATILF
ncbi:GNAT family N-acetyltransferase [Kribbella capetownensis]|uniref:GNAT family N-acetyltransferase n=1 Tax=Kribbella capetownensis TaxID=1572659 RepID=A0A4R0JTS8_9ACTN|nr:GNAT family N-acetyltransferase [Kribbella capetownensis]TCC49957.1 GNAT family N-acetyltransferase [Kribbella capetownensis]